MRGEIGREPSEPELAHYMEFPVEKLRQYSLLSRNVVSLEKPLRSTSNGKNEGMDTRTLGDTIASDAPTPLEDAQQASLRQDLDAVLQDALTATERTVLLTRYGLDDGHSKTLEETSRQLGVSRDRVRVVEARALNKLRSPQKNYRLKTYLGGSNGVDATAPTAANPKLTSTTATAASPQNWILENMNKNSVSSTRSEERSAEVVNPFASPLNYGARASGDENSADAAPDRLWFL